MAEITPMADQTDAVTPLEEVLKPDGPYFELLLMDDEHPAGVVGHVCNQCGWDVRDGTCPEHAPRDVPGLTLVACDATPRHWLWIIAGDYYDPPCYRCDAIWLRQRDEERRDAPHRRWRHWYRRTDWWERLLRVGSRLGLLTGRWAQTCRGGGWCAVAVVSVTKRVADPGSVNQAPTGAVSSLEEVTG